ncbi:MAG: RNA 2',3'-cyclic phosphodiesterase [Bacteroidales bacterium]|nr:RNA 2',3'-cyclic phosphodiesterase [Bacteroidales bacterium]
MIRLFIAIKLNAGKPLLDFFTTLKSELKHESIKWVNPEQMHLTLKFIGETHPDKVPVISSELDSISQKHKSFDLQFDKHGIFGSRYDPRVVWIGSQNQSPEIFALANDVLDGMDRIGFARDRQNFVPHLTLGRIRSLTDKHRFHRIFDQLPSAVYLNTSVDRFHLYESKLTPSGPKYTILHSCLLSH